MVYIDLVSWWMAWMGRKLHKSRATVCSVVGLPLIVVDSKNERQDKALQGGF